MPKFKTAIIDPPWPYGAASKHEKLSGYVTQDGNDQYPTLTIEDLKKLPISDVMDQDEAYVFLWTVGPFTEDAYALVRAWGFEPKSQMIWYKSDKGLGVGYWFRGTHELIIVGKRPNAPSIRSGESSVIVHPRITKKMRPEGYGHSAKPDTLYELIERQRPPHIRKNKAGEPVGETETNYPGPYLEIFARRARPGWASLGNEAPGDFKDIRVSLPELIQKVVTEDATLGDGSTENTKAEAKTNEP